MKKSILIFCLLFLTVFANPIHEDEEPAVGNVTHGDGEHHGEHEVKILLTWFSSITVK